MMHHCIQVVLTRTLHDVELGDKYMCVILVECFAEHNFNLRPTHDTVKGSTVAKLARCIIFALRSRKLYAPQVIMMPRGIAQVYTCTACCSFGHCRSIQQGSVICTTTLEAICLIQSTRLTSEGCSISLGH